MKDNFILSEDSSNKDYTEGALKQKKRPPCVEQHFFLRNHICYLVSSHQKAWRDWWRDGGHLPSSTSVMAKVISGVLDKMSSWPSALCQIFWALQTFFPDDDWQISLVILAFLVRHFRWLNPAGQNVRQGLSSLTDLSGIFCDHWSTPQIPSSAFKIQSVGK